MDSPFQDKEDPCLFSKSVEKRRDLLGDLCRRRIIASNQQSLINEFLDVLGAEVQIRSHPVKRFVGININRDRQKKKIHLSQPDYTTEVIEKFRMTICFP
jgi:hypothetical protein